MNAFDEATAYIRVNGSKPPADETTVVGGVIRREYRIKAGTMLVSDTHPYDHLSILLSGEALLKADGKVTSLIGPRILEIKAGVEHALYAVTDCKWDCLHALSAAEEAHANGNRHALDGVEVT